MDTRRAASLRVSFCVSAMVLAGSLARSLYHAKVRICKRKVSILVKPVECPWDSQAIISLPLVCEAVFYTILEGDGDHPAVVHVDVVDD